MVLLKCFLWIFYSNWQDTRGDHVVSVRFLVCLSHIPCFKALASCWMELGSVLACASLSANHSSTEETSFQSEAN